MQGSASAYRCIAPDVHTARPVTPDKIRKYSCLSKGEPAKIVVHPGLVGLKLPPSEHRYGILGDKSEQVASVITNPTKAPIEEYMERDRELVYKSVRTKPLGKPTSKGIILPDKTKEDDFAFGISSGKSVSAKGLIYHESAEESKKFFRRKAVEPPECEREFTAQANRYYDWDAIGKDPNTFAFGRPKQPAFRAEGVGHALNCRFEDMSLAAEAEAGERIERINKTEAKRLSTEPLGAPRELPEAVKKLGADFVYGHPPGAKDGWGAGKTLEGAYTAEEQKPDSDLGTIGRHDRYRVRLQGKCAEPGHVFGNPSIRLDRPPPALRSIADNKNYGDESDAMGLLYPPKFAEVGITESDFEAPRTEDQLREISVVMNQPASDEEFLQAIAAMKQSGATLNVRQFHTTLTKLRAQKC